MRVPENVGSVSVPGFFSDPGAARMRPSVVSVSGCSSSELKTRAVLIPVGGDCLSDSAVTTADAPSAGLENVSPISV